MRKSAAHKKAKALDRDCDARYGSSPAARKVSFPYRVEFSSTINTKLEKAAAKMQPSPQRYLQALIDDLLPGKIGKVAMSVDGQVSARVDAQANDKEQVSNNGGGAGDGSIATNGGKLNYDAMGLLTGTVKVVHASNGDARVSELSKLTKAHKWAYHALCSLSKGEPYPTSQKLLMGELDLSQGRVSAVIKVLCEAGLIDWRRAKGNKKSVLVAPFSGGSESCASLRSTCDSKRETNKQHGAAAARGRSSEMSASTGQARGQASQANGIKESEGV